MWILTGSEPLEIHSYLSSYILFIVDLQCITTRKVKSGCALNPKFCPQFRESEQNSHESVALSPGNITHNAIFICIFGESEPIYHETVALSPGTKAVRQIYQKILLTPPPKYPPSIFPVHFITRNVAQVTVTKGQRWQTTRKTEFVKT